MARLRLEWALRIEALHPRRIASAVLDLLLPPSCLTCAARVDAPGLQCGACFQTLTLLAEPCCACCGLPFELAGEAVEAGLCQRCVDSPPVFQRARAAFRYDTASSRLILPFKHGDRIELAQVLSRQMARAGAALLGDADLLVPVPLHRRRLFQRRYNQAAMLAFALGRRAGLPVIPGLLTRLRFTQSLGRKSAGERRDEIGGAFALRRGRHAAVEGRRVLLIDDVMTSGATADACASVLLASGAASVDVLVAALVPDPRKTPKPQRFKRDPSRKPPRTGPAA